MEVGIYLLELFIEIISCIHTYHDMMIVGYFQTQWRPVTFSTTRSRWNY